MSPDMSKKKSNTGWIIAGVIIVIVIIVVGVVAYMQLYPAANPSPSPTETPSTSPSTSATPSGSAIALTLFAGSVPGSSLYGFGDSASSITSPGPTLTLTMGQTYTMTVNNVGDVPHSWEISSTKAVGTPMWGAGIDIDTFIPTGSSASVTFTPTETGNFHYVCTVLGHLTLGMWGNVVVNP